MLDLQETEVWILLQNHRSYIETQVVVVAKRLSSFVPASRDDEDRSEISAIGRRRTNW
jgi:hypothetical protein